MPEAKKSKAKAIRVGVLLVILAGVGLQYLRFSLAESWTPSWESGETAAIVVLIPQDLSEEEEEVLAKLREFAFADGGKATFTALRYWFQREHGRYGAAEFTPVMFEVMGPLEISAMPPAPPRAGESMSFLQRYERTTAFLYYYAGQRERAKFLSKNAVFVTFYKSSQKHLFEGVHSVADRRSRSSFVFAPLTEKGSEAAVINTAHELLHLFGASDKYDGQRCVYPAGFYAPFQQPRYPQPCAEVMAQGIPVATGHVEAELELFENMRVGVETAFEIGWIDQVRRDRYYGGDVSAGPKEEEE